jgi:hypothetical protein
MKEQGWHFKLKAKLEEILAFAIIVKKWGTSEECVLSILQASHLRHVHRDNNYPDKCYLIKQPYMLDSRKRRKPRCRDWELEVATTKCVKG